MNTNLFPSVDQNKPEIRIPKNTLDSSPTGKDKKIETQNKRDKSFADTLRDDNDKTNYTNKPATQEAISKNSSKPNNDRRENNTDVKSDNNDRSENNKFQKSDSIKKLSRLIGKGTVATEKSQVLALASGDLAKVNPEQLLNLITGDNFVNEAIGTNIEEYMQKPIAVSELMNKLDIPGNIQEQAQILGLSLNEEITPVEFFKSIGIDPHKVIAQLNHIKVDLPSKGITVLQSEVIATQMTQKPILKSEKISQPELPHQFKKKKDELNNNLESLIPGQIAQTGNNPIVDIKKSEKPEVELNNQFNQVSDSQPSNLNSQNFMSREPQKNTDTLQKLILQTDIPPTENILADQDTKELLTNPIGVENKPTFSPENSGKPILEEIKNTNQSSVTSNNKIGKMGEIVQEDPYQEIKKLMSQIETTQYNQSPNKNDKVDQFKVENNLSRMKLGLDKLTTTTIETETDNKETKDIASEDMETLPIHQRKDSGQLLAKNAAIASKLFNNNGMEQSKSDISKTELSTINSSEIKIEKNSDSDSKQEMNSDSDNQPSQDQGSKKSENMIHGPQIHQMANKNKFHVEKTEHTQKAQETSFTDSIIKNAQMMVKNGGGSAILDLSSPEMGQLKLAIQVEEDKVNIRVLTSSDKTKHILSSEMAKLLDSLSSQNLRLQQVEMSTAEKFNQQQQSNQQNFFSNQGQDQRNQGTFEQITQQGISSTQNSIENLDKSIQTRAQQLKKILNPYGNIQVVA